jgi:chromosome partitioning protein
MAAVTLPDEDVAARGRSIFERLRAEQDAAAATPEPEVLDTPAGRRLAWDALELVNDGSIDHSEPFGRELDPSPEAAGVLDEAAETATTPVPLPPQEAERVDASETMAQKPAVVPAPANTSIDAPALPAAEASSALSAPPANSNAVAPAAELTELPPPVPARPVSTPPVMPDLPEVRPPAPPAAARPASTSVPQSELPPERPSFARPLPRIIAIANQKGGVGKTTTTVNLGASLAVLGYRVLVVDLDPQGNATTGLGINSRNLEHSIYDVVLHDVPMDDCVEPTSLRNLYVAPATIDLAGAEIELVPAFSRELRLRRALEEVRDDYDFVLIDCPPSLGLLTVNGLAAATEVLVPIQCEYYALEGLGQLLRNVNLVQSNLNPKLELSAIVLTMYDARTKLAEQVADEVRTHFGPKVCRNVVPRTVRLSEAPSFGQPIIVFDPSSRGALAYRELAKEVAGGAPQRAG